MLNDSYSNGWFKFSFFKAGYKKPKYMLEAHGMSLFEHSIRSFETYFKTKSFLFIVRDVYETPEFVKQRAEALGITSFEVIILKEETRGQAETVYLGLQKSEKDKEQSITIFNIDTFRPKFEFPKVSYFCDAYLEVFEGKGDNWSFAEAKNKNSKEVVRTSEKKPISNLCSTGLYHFNDIEDYLVAYEESLSKPENEWEQGELYIAPLYNSIIKKGKRVSYHLISQDDVIFCGIPEEYITFLNQKCT